MEVHAEYFLKCPEIAKWLNTPEPVTGIPKEFLDCAHAITSHVSVRDLSPFPAPVGLPFYVPETPPPASPPPVSTPRPKQSSPVSTPRPKQTSPISTQAYACAEQTHTPASTALAPVLDVKAVDNGFPDLDAPQDGKITRKTVVYVPVALHEHFVFGVVLGCVIPPPQGVCRKNWVPLVNRFVIDSGRRCCFMFSYYAEGSIVVSVDCYDESGDHFIEATFFEPTPVVGVFPRGIKGRMKIFERRDCQNCRNARRTCQCGIVDRVKKNMAEKRNGTLRRERGPVHGATTYNDDKATIHTYPYWAQLLDEFQSNRTGSYYVSINYMPATGGFVAGMRPCLKHWAYRAEASAEPIATVDKMLRVSLFDKGVSALSPPATDVTWDTSSTISVNHTNTVKVDKDPVNAVCLTDLRKWPGLQEDYLLIAPSNIVSGAHARAELARAEAARMEARERDGVPVLPSWVSGGTGVREHITSECSPELDMVRQAINTRNDDFEGASRDFPAQMLRRIPEDSAGTVMRPRVGIDKRLMSSAKPPRTGMDNFRRHSDDVPRMRFVERFRRSSVDSVIRREGSSAVESTAVDSNRRPGRR